MAGRPLGALRVVTWLVLFGVAALGLSASTPAGQQLPEGIRLVNRMRAALRHWHGVEDSKAVQAARELFDLYQQLQRQKDLAPQRKAYWSRRLVYRLDRLCLQIAKAELARRQAKLSFDSIAAAGAKRPAHVAHRQNRVLAQMAGRGRPLQHPGDYRLFGGSTAAGVGPAGPQQGFPPDSGLELVELIQRVIHPESWKVNGGQGTIYYWRPGRVLVVRQTQEVHREIAQLLEQLRRLQN